MQHTSIENLNEGYNFGVKINLFGHVERYISIYTCMQIQLLIYCTCVQAYL